MRFFVLICIFFFSMLSAFSTEASVFAEQQYASLNKCEQVHINVKKEHTIENLQEIGKHKIPAITFGYGDLKAKKHKKIRISYICLLDEDFKPVWSYVIPSE